MCKRDSGVNQQKPKYASITRWYKLEKKGVCHLKSIMTHDGTLLVHFPHGYGDILHDNLANKLNMNIKAITCALGESQAY